MEYLEQLQQMCRGMAVICPNIEDLTKDAIGDLESQHDDASQEREELKEKQRAEARAEELAQNEYEERRYFETRQAAESTCQQPSHSSTTQSTSRLDLLVDQLCSIDPMKHLFDDL